ncbi:PadR family transcriptional regulator [Cellulomonas oligotrophica]|uniref:Transcriptional regulator n=1 Tax=Cellulomonas oligotrophica TaxID=931536 RepID=A0A7Y9FJ54_9CELL|nr:PadR family transcriptional regulator [Cellulomonas oligotrophica]NYD87847.1 PadR family transcriptional regulator PadR [Cellulomonas oligotrophica]GIG32946.1 transcriptional regulator [Cellulomonas oligotrophica]
MTDAAWPVEWQRGLLATAILGAVGGAEPVYGYAISQRLEQLGWGSVTGGALYPALRALEAAGLVTSRWDPQASGPARRYYDLTPEGRDAIRRHQDSWPRFSGAMTALLHGEEGPR